MNRFFRSLDRAFDAMIGPGDSPGWSRLWAIKALTIGGAVYLVYCTPVGEWSRPIMAIVVIGLGIVLSLVIELKKLLIRVERLESEAEARRVADVHRAETLLSS